MTTVITKATPADLLAALPVLAGRAPDNSVVMLAFAGKRTHAALRFDIPSSGHKRFATTASGLFCKIPGADDVVPVIWSDAPLATHVELMGTIIRRFEQAGFAVRDALLVGAEGWRSYFSPQVHPLHEIEAASARLALDPPTEVPDRVPPADDLAVRRMAGELERLRMLALDDPESDELAPLDDVPWLAERALAGEGREALLLLALQGPPERDLVMLQWAFGLELGDAMWAADTCAGFEARKLHPDIDSQAAELMLGRGPAPDRERVEAAIAVLTNLVSLAEDALRPALLCMLAWLHWSRGRGSIAGVHLDEVHTIAPDYSMGQLMRTLFGSGTMPEWVFELPSSPQI